MFNQVISNANEVKFEECIAKGLVHPNTFIVSQLRSDPDFVTFKEINNYIGVSFMCCILCSIYLESFSLEFRGKCKRFFRDWDFDGNENEALKTNLSKFCDAIQNHQGVLVNLTDRDRETDPFCGQINDLCSDDMCLMFRFIRPIFQNDAFFDLFNLDLIDYLKERRDGLLKNPCNPHDYS